MDILDHLLSRIDQSQTETGKKVIWIKMSSIDWQRILKASRSDARLFTSKNADDLESGVVGMLPDRGIYLQASRDFPEGKTEFSHYETSH